MKVKIEKWKLLIYSTYQIQYLERTLWRAQCWRWKCFWCLRSHRFTDSVHRWFEINFFSSAYFSRQDSRSGMTRDEKKSPVTSDIGISIFSILFSIGIFCRMGSVRSRSQIHIHSMLIVALKLLLHAFSDIFESGRCGNGKGNGGQIRQRSCRTRSKVGWYFFYIY